MADIQKVEPWEKMLNDLFFAVFGNGAEGIKSQVKTIHVKMDFLQEAINAIKNEICIIKKENTEQIKTINNAIDKYIDIEQKRRIKEREKEIKFLEEREKILKEKREALKATEEALLDKRKANIRAKIALTVSIVSFLFGAVMTILKLLQ